MEKRHLPILSGRVPHGTRPEAPQIGEKSIEKIARAFLLQRYPLTAAGQLLKMKVEEALSQGDSIALDALSEHLPTVEQPQLELFADLLPLARSANVQRDLTNIQVSKGCRHACDFCAAGAEKTVEIMPFAAILKIHEERAWHEAEIPGAIMAMEQDMTRVWPTFEQNVDLFFSKLDRATEAKIASLPSEGSHVAMEMDIAYEGRKKLVRVSRAHQKNFLVYEKLIATIDVMVSMNSYSQWNSVLRTFRAELVVLATQVDQWYKTRDWANVLSKNGIQSQNGTYEYRSLTTNYYDSDPFDYRDAKFRHEDGSPADYGDVVALLASDDHPIHITTAGWPRNDRTAQRAAEKIVAHFAAHPGHAALLRVSISPYEMTAKRDLDAYWLNIKNVLETLAGCSQGVQVLLFQPGEEHGLSLDFKRKIVAAVRDLAKQLPDGRLDVCVSAISDFSTPDAFTGGAYANHDVMACMPGYHVWPDGTIAVQKELAVGEKRKFSQQKAPSGSRPTPVGRVYMTMKESDRV